MKPNSPDHTLFQAERDGITAQGGGQSPTLALVPPPASQITRELARTTGQDKGDKQADFSLVRQLHAMLETLDGNGRPWSRSSIAKRMGRSNEVSLYMAQCDALGVPNPKAPPMTFNLVRLEATVVDFLAAVKERRAYARDIEDTVMCRNIRGFIGNMRAVSGIGVFIGPAGEGKTSAIEHYRRNNPMAMCICATAMSRCAADIMEAVFSLVNRGNRWPRNVRRTAWVIERMKEGDGNQVILLDNYQRLTLDSYRLLFDLHDATSVPLVMFGDHTGLEKIGSDPQLYSRVTQSTQATWLLSGKADTEAGRNREIDDNLRDAVEKVLQRECPQWAGELRGLALQVARQPGRLRGVLNHLRQTREIMGRTDRQSMTAAEAFRTAHEQVLHSGYKLE